MWESGGWANPTVKFVVTNDGGSVPDWKRDLYKNEDWWKSITEKAQINFRLQIRGFPGSSGTPAYFTYYWVEDRQRYEDIEWRIHHLEFRGKHDDLINLTTNNKKPNPKRS